MAQLLLNMRGIFFKIYTGLLVICLVVALFSYLFATSINQARLQAYRENIATSMSYLINEGISRQSSAADKNTWLTDVSNLFGSDFALLSIDTTDFKNKELRRLNDGLSVVRQDYNNNQFSIYHKISNNDVLVIKVSSIGDRQVRAMMILLLDDLSYYSSSLAKENRLSHLTKKIGFDVRMQDILSLNLDQSQIMRLLNDDMVIVFEDSTIKEGLSITVIAPSQIKGQVIVAGPLALFNWFPLNLIISTAFMAVLLISLGVYALIYPLQRRLSLLQAGVDRVSKGDLDTKVQAMGDDDIARLSHTFNAMIAHIKRLIESQRELTRAVSHELRTPVARIRFAVDMLADDDDYQSRQVQREHIDDDIEALNDLIDEILTYAKLEEGAPKMEWQMVNLAELVTQVCQETEALGKPLTISVNIMSGKVMAMADRRYLHRVLQNLATNATRYAKSRIIISAGVVNKQAFVMVEDDGQGIKPADRDKVFVPFARLDDSRTRASGGYGLGLSIVSRIAFWFHGQMSVDESKSLGGALFVMRWPVKQVGASIAADSLTQQKSADKVLYSTK